MIYWIQCCFREANLQKSRETIFMIVNLMFSSRNPYFVQSTHVTWISRTRTIIARPFTDFSPIELSHLAVSSPFSHTWETTGTCIPVGAKDKVGITNSLPLRILSVQREFLAVETGNCRFSTAFQTDRAADKTKLPLPLAVLSPFGLSEVQRAMFRRKKVMQSSVKVLRGQRRCRNSKNC